MNKTDQELLVEISEGSSKSFELLYERHKNKVYGFCKKIVGDKNMVDDITQESWMKIIKNSGNYSYGSDATSWILTIAKNTCFDHLRKKRKIIETQEFKDIEIELEESAQNALNIEALIENAESFEQLKKCIEQLPQNLKSALTLWLSDDRPQEEMAKDIEISLASYKVLIFRAKEKLSLCLKRFL
ncbi:MAG TPA: RNA polymerase sigma factor [Pseudobdellovibrionaceae bacterium]|nr:RNA polymerase sigma factor [Pseudobdellovibrionaceae bacterium]